MSKAKRVSLSIEVAQGRGKMWASCWVVQGSWWHRASSSHQSLPASPAFRDTRSCRPRGSLQPGRFYSSCQIRHELNSQANYTIPRTLMGCILRADIILRALPIILESSLWLWEVPEDQWKTNITPLLNKGKTEDPGICRQLCLTILGKTMEQLILETSSRHTKDKKEIVNSQHGFSKEN